MFAHEHNSVETTTHMSRATREDRLFSEQEPFSYQVKQETEHIPPITRDELRRENKRIGNSKAPGMDAQRGIEDGSQHDTWDVSRHVQYMPRRGNLPRAIETAETCTLAHGQ